MLLSGAWGGPSRPAASDGAYALHDVNLEVDRGEGFGLIGANGAGKSTLLKVIGGITGLTEGSVEVQGSVASLIEVGAGFHPDLTGRENVYLNASMMGLKRARIEQLLEAIISFAGLGEYIEMPVRTYSSGMVVRLGFAVAIHVRPDILLIDEVLSVGDISFQGKSFERIQAERRRGTTIVFVSHSMPAVSAVCDRAAWIDAGRVRMLGPATEVIRAYQDDEDRKLAQDSLEKGGEGDLKIERVELLDADGVPCEEIGFLSTLTVRLHFSAPRAFPKPYFILTIECRGAAVFGANMGVDGSQPEVLEGAGTLDCTFPEVRLAPGVYDVGVQVRANPGVNYFDYRVMKRFLVRGDLRTHGFRGDYVDTVSRGMAPVLLPYEWKLSVRGARE